MSVHTQERPPSAVGRAGRSEDRLGGGSPTTVPQNEEIPAFNTMNSRGKLIATAFYESGVVAGIAIGREQAEEEMAQLWRQAHQVVQAIAKQPDFAELCDRRGEPHRAEHQLQLLRQRGVIS